MAQISSEFLLPNGVKMKNRLSNSFLLDGRRCLPIAINWFQPGLWGLGFVHCCLETRTDIRHQNSIVQARTSTSLART